MTQRNRRLLWCATALIGVLGVTWFTSTRKPAKRDAPESSRIETSDQLDVAQSTITDAAQMESARVATEPSANIGLPLAVLADVQVHVVDEQGQAQPGAIVTIETTRGSTSFVLTCDSLGFATLGGLDVGRIAVRGLTRGETAITLRPGLNKVDLVLPRAEDLLVMVADPTGAAISGADIYVSDPRDRLASARVGHTDALGKFTITGLAADRGIFVTKAGYEQSAEYPQWQALLQLPRTMRVELVPGGCRLSGLVRIAETRTVVPNAHVRVCGLRPRELPPAPGRSAVLAGPATVRHAQTGADGRFALDDAPAPPLRVEVVAAGFARHQADVDARQSGSDVDVQIDVLLVPGATLDGVVLDQTSSPVSKALVSLSPATSDAARAIETTVTSDDGIFRFGDIVSGSYRWSVTASGGRSAVGDVRVPLTRRIQVRLPTSPEASGRIVDTTGTAIPYWRVGWAREQVVADSGAFPTTTVGCDADGRFWLPSDCESGGWIYAWPPGLCSMPVIVARRRAAEAVELLVDASVRKLGSITLRSVESDREFVLIARLVRTDSGVGALRGVDPRTGAPYSGLLAGTYELFLQLGNAGWKDAGRFDLGVGEERTLTVPTSDVIRALPPVR